jgi:hypothetical protein
MRFSGWTGLIAISAGLIAIKLLFQPLLIGLIVAAVVSFITGGIETWIRNNGMTSEKHKEEIVNALETARQFCNGTRNLHNLPPVEDDYDCDQCPASKGFRSCQFRGTRKTFLTAIQKDNQS